jgi:spore photoproduct lyase
VRGWAPKQIWIENGEEQSPTARRVRSLFANVPTVVAADPRAANPNGADRFASGKRLLMLQRHRGSFLQHCPAGTPGLVCCNYLVVNFASNCPFDCSYCFLQEYLANNAALKVYTNPGDALAEIDAALRAHPRRDFRIGTGELADSLALDEITGLTNELVPFFAERRNATLELKTKSACIDNLLRLDPKDRVVASWSVNAPAIVAVEESGTASLGQRIEAARRVQEAGYRLGFHFDPLIEHEGWQEGYREAVAMLATAVDSRRIAWISLGSLRVSHGLRAAMRSRPTATRVLSAELVPGPDGKARLWRGLRLQMYRRVESYLREAFPGVPSYLCMEPPGVWQAVRGEVPSDRTVAERLTIGSSS